MENRGMTVLALTKWRDLEAAHGARVDAATEAHRRRRPSARDTRPRTSSSPTPDHSDPAAPLAPGLGVGLDRAAGLPPRLLALLPRGRPDRLGRRRCHGDHRAEGIRFVEDLLSAVDGREPRLRCFALHGGPWSPAVAGAGAAHPAALAAGPGWDRRRRREPLAALHAYRRLPLLHPGRSRATPSSRAATPRSPSTSPAVCTPGWTSTSGPPSSPRPSPASWS